MSGTKLPLLDAPPTAFLLPAHLGTWCSWARVTKCFWPRYSGFNTSKKADAELAPMVYLGGIYLIANSGIQAPLSLHAADPSVIYVGETSWYKRRIGQFGDSAGLWDDGLRTKGHSAGLRVKLQRDRLWIAFFPVEWPRGQRHLGIGLRLWLEALAIEEHRVANGSLPIVNAGEEAEERKKEAAEASIDAGEGEDDAAP
ncbi:MAG: hypothetical protein E6J90_15745 [Deltaproteobacteria bacterium]|nr:MAG: hypothetical protein E6J90_15745 [Deltaproteobacteria bacterium]